MQLAKCAAIVLLTLLLGACATSRGFDRGALKAHAAVAEIDDEDIARALALRPQLPPHYRLAVYFTPARTQWPRPRPWRWTGEDKAAVLRFTGPLVEAGVTADAFAIGEAVLEGTDRKAIRLAAARAGADAVLIVEGVADVDRYNNRLGPTYALLVTAAFVPGTVADGLFIASASLWDVRNDFLYLSIEAEGMVRRTAPAAFVDEDRIVREAKAQALEELRKQLAGRLTRLGPA